MAPLFSQARSQFRVVQTSGLLSQEPHAVRHKLVKSMVLFVHYMERHEDDMMWNQCNNYDLGRDYEILPPLRLPTIIT